MGEGGRVLRVVEEIVIEATPERVFRALSTPEDIVRWWRIDEGYETTSAEMDLRPGGRYRLSGTSRELGSFQVSGTYLVVEPPGRLVYTWSPDWEEEARESRVEFTLEQVPEGTRVRVTHTGFLTERARDVHAGGWPRVLRVLAAWAGRSGARG